MECLTIEDKINYIFNSVQKTESAVGVQQARIEKLETSYEALSNEVLTLKNLVNVREQELRTCNIRISGFPLTGGEDVRLQVSQRENLRQSPATYSHRCQG